MRQNRDYKLSPHHEYNALVTTYMDKLQNAQKH